MLWPRSGLWRHADFLRLWAAQTVSHFGSHVTLLALPLVAVLTLEATAFEVAALGAAEYAPFLLFTLVAGVWVDRVRRRPLLIAADVARALVLVSIPLAYAFDALTI
jgi:MFS family permease